MGHGVEAARPVERIRRERPGTAEWLALAFVLSSLVAVLWPSKAVAKTAPVPPAD